MIGISDIFARIEEKKDDALLKYNQRKMRGMDEYRNPNPHAISGQQD
jgi:hypothetical protein